MRCAVATAIAIALALPGTVSAGAADDEPQREALVRRLAAEGVPAGPLDLALRAVACGRTQGEIESPLLTLIDFERPSRERRLWVIDLAAAAVRFHELVAHGRESGLRRARMFSNLPGSLQSSLGLFRTGDTYVGRHGYSLRLIGLEPGTNDLAYERGIVVHAAEYATPAFAAEHGRLGRSWGCPALDPAVSRELIDTIRGGSAVFAYYPESRWLASSPFLRCEEPAPSRPIPSLVSLRSRIAPFPSSDAFAAR